MKVAVNVLAATLEPQIYFHREQVLAMMLGPVCLEVGSHWSEMRRLECYCNQIMLLEGKADLWIRTHTDGLQLLEISISADVLGPEDSQISGDVKLPSLHDITDPRIRALVNAVNAERLAGFPSGRLFLDSVERAIAVALAAYGLGRPSAPTYRGGLGPARLRRVKELVVAKLEQGLTLQEMARSVELSVAHFSQMFRHSTGRTPHQFVLHQRIERAKEMLRTNGARALDIAMACGFKTQQHFSRVFRQLCGMTPREYRSEYCGDTTLPSPVVHHTLASLRRAGKL
jgi:AraC family transcriptional regulator